jgi:hypothetical protein
MGSNPSQRHNPWVRCPTKGEWARKTRCSLAQSQVAPKCWPDLQKSDHYRSICHRSGRT